MVSCSGSSACGDAPAGNDADFLQALDPEKLNKHLAAVSGKLEKFQKTFEKLGETPDAGHACTIGDAEKLLKKAKGQINRGAILALMSRPMIRNPQRGKDLRGCLEKILESTKRLGLEEHVPEQLMANAQQVLEDAKVAVEDAEGEANVSGGVGHVGKTRKTKDSKQKKAEKNATAPKGAGQRRKKKVAGAVKMVEEDDEGAMSGASSDDEGPCEERSEEEQSEEEEEPPVVAPPPKRKRAAQETVTIT